MNNRDPVETAAVTVDAAVAFLLLMFVPLLFQMALILVGFRTEAVQNVESVSVLYMFGIMLLCAFAGLRHDTLSFRLQGNVTRTIGAYVMFMLLWVPFGLILYPMLVRAAGSTLPPQSTLTYLATATPSVGLLLVVLLACVVAPIGEELFFRGYLYRALQLRTDDRVALIGTSLLFGIVHGQKYAIPLILMGLFFGWLRKRTGGLAAPILAHMLHNSLTVACTLTWPGFLEQVFDQAAH